MAATVELIEPRRIFKNPDNPRLIFRDKELAALEDSIREQGILVPLTVFQDGKNYTLLDGERRWRCAMRLGLHRVPVIVQQKPDRVTNIMMMFAIHNARQDWDPLPTALKLEELEKIMTQASGQPPIERRLAAAASMSIGEVRRYKKILALPLKLRTELMNELEKPRSEQRLTVDHVIESVDGVSRLKKAEVLSSADADLLLTTVVEKFRSGVLQSTVEPRKFSRIARAVEREEVPISEVRSQLRRFERSPQVTINEVFQKTVERADFAHGTDQLVRRSIARLKEIEASGAVLSEELRASLIELSKLIERMLRH